MANTINFILTNAAAELIPKILNGKTLNFTRMAVGDGFSYDENVAKGFTTLVNEVLSLNITKKEIENSSTVKITSAFTSSDLQKEFYYREVGLFAQDPDTGKEILYAYGNRNEAAELITPNGSSSVAKKLVFIVLVGNSANVTVNITSDIYDKADKNLANTGMITNCLLEVPQNIRLDLVDGAIVLKAGSIVTKPNGEQKIIEEDISYKPTWAEGVLLILYGDSGLNNSPLNIDCFSGDEEPDITSDGIWWFDTTNKIFKTSFNGAWVEVNDICLPIGLAKATKEGFISIDQVFNGMGYIGSTVWIDKGVKGLIPKGRNPDGTLNNIEYTTTSIAFKNSGDWDYSDINFFVNTEGKLGHNYLFESEEVIPNVDAKTYVPLKNFIYWQDGTTHEELYVAKATIENNKITSFKPYTTFKAVDKSSDKSWLSGLAMPSEKYIDLELGERGTTYKARANGYFAIRKVAGIANGSFTMAVWNTAATEEFHRTTIISPLETAEIAFSVPVLKGQTVAVDYDATGETQYFRFIYAQGEVN